MRNILFLIICLILLTGGVVSNAQTNSEQEGNIVDQDSTISVTGYFSKNDTLIYWINKSNWKFSSSDTIKTAGISKKVRLTVVDSTATGYKMDYTFLEFKGDSLEFKGDSIESPSLAIFQNAIEENLGKKLVGTTIHFETDEFGAITKINNLDQINRQAKSLFKEAMNEALQLSETVGMKKEFSIELKTVDSDKLVDGYLEELKLLFLCHGFTYDLGESHIHEDATETNYEYDTYSTVALDTTDYTYMVSTDIVNIIPQTEIKDIVGMMNNDSIKELFNDSIDSQVKEDAIIDSYISFEYLPNGYPYRVVKQIISAIGERGKSKQTYIYLDYLNY